MSTSPDPSDPLEKRVHNLEKTVDDLRETVAALRQRLDDRSADEPESAEVPTVAENAHTDSKGSILGRLRKRVQRIGETDGQEWLARVGVGLLLFGLVFLFNYAVEAGWLVPSVRAGFGVVLGAVLLVGGLRQMGTRPRLAALLLGGSSAAFYATGFAAYELYALVPYPFAFAAMATVTVWTFALAVRQDDALLGVVAVSGGLGTPFLLATDAGSAAGFVVYVALVIAGGALLVVRRGWQLLLWTVFIGGWASLLAGVLVLPIDTIGSRWAVQTGLVYGWIVLGGMPVARMLRHGAADSVGGSGKVAAWLRRQLDRRPPYVFVNAAPFLALAGTRFLWENVSGTTWGGLALAAGLGYVGAVFALHRQSLTRYASAHALAAAVLAGYGLTQILGGSTLLIALAVEAAVLIVIGTRTRDASLRRAGHSVALIVAIWWGNRVATPEPEAARLISAHALSELAVLGIAAALALRLDGRRIRTVYQVALHAGWLAWIWNELLPLSNGQAYVSGAWGLTAVGLLVAGTTTRTRRLQVAGLLTLALFVTKLFLVDLSALPALWRIVLFLASGGLFVLLSYLLPDLTGEAPAGAAERDGPEESGRGEGT